MRTIISKILRKGGYVISRLHGYPRPMIRFVNEKFGNKELIGVEIGVWRGGNAESILKTININKLYLIDPYKFYEEYKENTVIKRAKETGITEQEDLDEAERIADKTLEPFKNKISFIKNTSEEAARIFKDCSLDFAYIDGNHSYKFVKEDIGAYYKKVKSGGVLGGDDFQNGFDSELNGVVNAVLEFVHKNKLQLYNHGKDWWVVKK